MSIITISRKLGAVERITGKTATTVGASIYVEGPLNEVEAARIRNEIDPQEIKLVRDLEVNNDGKTVIRL